MMEGRDGPVGKCPSSEERARQSSQAAALGSTWVGCRGKGCGGGRRVTGGNGRRQRPDHLGARLCGMHARDQPTERQTGESSRCSPCPSLALMLAFPSLSIFSFFLLFPQQATRSQTNMMGPRSRCGLKETNASSTPAYDVSHRSQATGAEGKPWHENMRKQLSSSRTLCFEPVCNHVHWSNCGASSIQQSAPGAMHISFTSLGMYLYICTYGCVPGRRFCSRPPARESRGPKLSKSPVGCMRTCRNYLPRTGSVHTMWTYGNLEES